MDDDRRLRLFALLILLAGWVLCPCSAVAQNFHRYKPQEIGPKPELKVEVPTTELPEDNLDDRILVEQLDAIILVDDANRVLMDESIDSLTGLHIKFSASDSIVYRSAVQRIVSRFLGKPVSLRNINHLTRDIIQYYQKCGQPIVDVAVPEQRITGGTLQIVITESRIGRVVIQPGCVFECQELDRWIECTRPGDRIYESRLKGHLFLLNQNPFRRVTVEFEKGAEAGTTDIHFKSSDVTPLRGYMGADDTGVESLNYGRLFSGFSYGNTFGRSGILGYQYTTDQEFARLEAHSISYSQPINRDFSLSSYGSWAGVSPELSGGLSQDGESWQFGMGLIHHLIRDPRRSRNLTAGVDFKSTNNNLEFAGTTVVTSNADLVQLRFGFDNLYRRDQLQYKSLRIDTYVGPGGGMTGAHSEAAFQTIRPGTSPEYIYGRLIAERTDTICYDWMVLSRFTGQASSERLLFSETLGLGGFETLRGFDERVVNSDHGWIANAEFGPRTIRWGDAENPRTLRPYLFTDLGNGYIDQPRPGEDGYTFAMSTGVGFRFAMSDRFSARFDWGYGLEDISQGTRDSRLHFGLTWIPGKRP